MTDIWVRGVRAWTKLHDLFQKVYSNRIKGIHLINAPPYVETVINLVRKVMKEKLASRVCLMFFSRSFLSVIYVLLQIYAHNSIDDLSTYISRDILPKDYGGEEIPLEEIQGKLI